VAAIGGEPHAHLAAILGILLPVHETCALQAIERARDGARGEAGMLRQLARVHRHVACSYQRETLQVGGGDAEFERHSVVERASLARQLPEEAEAEQGHFFGARSTAAWNHGRVIHAAPGPSPRRSTSHVKAGAFAHALAE